MIAPAYRYRAALKRVIDGDTYILDIDYGFHQHGHMEIRLHGWSAPEAGTERGDAATAFARTQLEGALEIVVESYRDRRSFARWVADVYVEGTHLGELLEEAGLAAPGARVG